MLHVFVEDVLAGREPDPAIVAQLLACPPCSEDFEALLDVSRLAGPPTARGTGRRRR